LAGVLAILRVLFYPAGLYPAGSSPAGPYPDGATKILVGIALFERTPISLVCRLVAVAHMTFPSPVVQLIPLAPITLTALLVGLIALASPRLTLLPLGSLVAFLVLAHAVPSAGERSRFESTSTATRVLRKPHAAQERWNPRTESKDCER
jgi:hypothetical protein